MAISMSLKMVHVIKNKKQITSNQQRFMRLAVAAADQIYAPHPTTRFHHQEKHNMAMVFMQPQHKQTKHALMRISGKLGIGFNSHGIMFIL